MVPSASLCAPAPLRETIIAARLANLTFDLVIRYTQSNMPGETPQLPAAFLNCVAFTAIDPENELSCPHRSEWTPITCTALHRMSKIVWA
jgi:hypothetical protein